MLKEMLQALDNYSYRGFVFRRTRKRKSIYLFRWGITFFVCYLFYLVVALSAFAGLLLLLNLIQGLW